MRKLTLDDVTDLHAYERERDTLRRRILELKRRRRVVLGPIMTLVFENTDTMRFQVQEMARAERMLRDEQIAHEIETYNELIPDPGGLSATLLIELTSEPALREWLPRLVGIERAIAIALPDGTVAPGRPRVEQRLTREGTTPAVHFLTFRLVPEQIEVLGTGPTRVVVDHPEYREDVELTDEQRAELAADLRS